MLVEPAAAAAAKPKPEDCLEGYQWCLQFMVTALQQSQIISTHVGQQVRALWFCYVEEIRARSVPLVDIYTTTQTKGKGTKRKKLEQQTKELRTGPPPPKAPDSTAQHDPSKIRMLQHWCGLPPLNPMLLVSMIYLGSRMWKEGLLGCDLLRFGLNGTLPYLQLYDHMPPSKQSLLRVYRQLYRPGIPCRLGVRRVPEWKVGRADYASNQLPGVPWSTAVEEIGMWLASELRCHVPAPNVQLMVSFESLDATDVLILFF